MAEYVALTCMVDRVTDKAVHVLYHDEDGRQQACWLPRSACMDGDTIDVDDEEVHVALWLAEERGLPL